MSRDVIFDLGGVVFRWQPLLLLQQLFADRVPDEKTAQHWAEQIFQGFLPGSDWAEFDLGHIEPEPLAQRIAQRTQFDVRDIGHLISSIPPHLIPIEGTVRLIEKLKQAGHRIYFLSNMPRPYAEHLTKTNAFFEHFVDGIFSAHVHEIKPKSSIFEIAQNRWALNNDVVFIDDVQKNIEAAVDFGWQGIQFSEPTQLHEELRKRQYL